jgi:hypothetical protein
MGDAPMLPEEFARKICDSLDLLNNQVVGMQTTMVSVQKSQERLFNIVANGNGQPSLISQAATMKARVDEASIDLKAIEGKVDTIERREAACHAQVQEQLKRRGNPAPVGESRLKRYGLIAAIGTGVASFCIKIFEWLCTGGSN